MSDASILFGVKTHSDKARNRLSISSRTTALRRSGDSTRDGFGDEASHSSSASDDIEDLDNPDPDNLPMFVDGRVYLARKPKPTLMRAIKQIVNPRKVAEKDAFKSQQDHFAWLEMQKSLRRVRSPGPGSKHDYFQQYFAPVESMPFIEVDPFETLKFSYNLKDAHGGTGLEIIPSSFTQADKLARNVNQKSSQLTPQILSQKYLTRPYARSPLLKLRVLFIWVSENIRLEGGPMRDVSGGRYKLGPAGDVAPTYYPPANGTIPPTMTSAIAKAINQTLKANSSPPNPRRTPASSTTNLAAAAAIAALSPNGGGGMAGPSLADGTSSSAPVISAAMASAFMQGLEDCSKSFLIEGAPENAQEVLTSRICRTGEGFANIFAEMAVAAGIEDVGVVKGHLKGPMDVFAKEIPPPNHAWNVVKIDGDYRFIDCCLASPFYPGHYPNKSKEAHSFYFLTPPSDMILTHFPTFLTYQYIAPPITTSVFLQLPFVRPAFFDYGLRFLDFKKRTRLEIKDDQPVEIFLVIGAGEGIDLRAEVEAMTAEGKVIKKRALAQVTVWRPNPNLLSSLAAGPGMNCLLSDGEEGLTAATASALAAVGTMATGVSPGTSRAHPGSPGSGRLSGRSGGIRIAKIKAVLPAETVTSVGDVRKGVVHIYAGRKVGNALADAMPYALAVTLPIRHTGTLPKTPFSFVLPHFSPYEYYIKAPQSELLYYPHIYKFSILSLAALSEAASMPLPGPIQWANLSPSPSGIFDSHPTTPSGSAIFNPTSPSSSTPVSSMSSPPPPHPSASSSASFSSSSPSKVMAVDQVGGSGGYASTTSGPRPSLLSQHRASQHHHGGVGSSTSPTTSAAMTAGMTTGAMVANSNQASSATSTLGPYGAVSSTTKQKQHLSSSSLASPNRLSQQQHQGLLGGAHSQLASSSSSATLGGHVRRLSSSSACSISSPPFKGTANYTTNTTMAMTTAMAMPSSASLFAQSIGAPVVARPERLVLRSQTNRIYKLVYDPVRQCHEAQIEIKERGLWECVRLDDGGKGRVGREGAGGVVIASWRCV
ncbi:cytokinesis protein 3 [Actinomortierella ambigua]|uniref:Cytokinesis protein 3 n=1 Tax=Actinomortierella ambigua TaxID=1343610 RepID=A0A9P6QN60_9FUNG|nr:cytokinesis protein 3 [Actinomortierella ambigua]